MGTNYRSLKLLVPVLLVSAACSTGAEPRAAESTLPVASSTTADPSVANTPADAFPIAAFAEISEEPIADEMAAALQAALDDMADDSGMTATVMSADGTWSGAAGTADGVRDMQIDDQFFVASITKSVVATQVMLMVEAGELSLDDLATERLPADLDFDANGATIRQLLNQRSGIPDFFLRIWGNLAIDRLHQWTTAEVLDVAGDKRSPVGESFEYADTNYVLLGMIIEQVRGRPIAEVLRSGALAVSGIERLVYQPDELPTEPMAMPDGESTATLDLGGGYLPSIASATAGGSAAAIASDSPSLAHWWRALCAGEIVSQASLTEMSILNPTRDSVGTWAPSGGYGLGLYNVAYPYAHAVGHTGVDVGFAAWAACLPASGTVVVVLSNRIVDDVGGMARPLIEALSSV